MVFPYGVNSDSIFIMTKIKDRQVSQILLQILEKYTMITIVGTFIITNGKECCIRVSIQCSLHQVIGKSKVKDNIIDLFSGGT